MDGWQIGRKTGKGIQTLAHSSPYLQNNNLKAICQNFNNGSLQEIGMRDNIFHLSLSFPVFCINNMYEFYTQNKRLFFKNYDWGAFTVLLKSTRLKVEEGFLTKIVKKKMPNIIWTETVHLQRPGVF